MQAKDQEIIFDGRLILDDHEYYVQTVYASRSSLFVHFNESGKIRKGTRFENFSLKMKGETISLGRCVFLPVDDVPNFEGRLIFIDNVYDFYSIVRYGKLADSESYFKNLYLLLQQRDKIKPEFVKFISDMSFDLNIYKKFFDDIDFKYRDEPEEVLVQIRRTIIDTEGRRFMIFFDSKLDELKEKIKDFSRVEHEYHGYYLRRQLWNIISSSEFLMRTNIRPRGYPGDSEMMRMVYENKYRGKNIFSMLMHKHPLETAAAQAVRNRKIMVPEHVFRTEKELNLKHETYRLLSVACGPASEIENIIQSPEICRKYHFTLLDQDGEALDESANNIKSIEDRLQMAVNHRYLYESVRTMMGIKNIEKKWGRFHFIYSMGLFDYLNSRVAKAVLKKLYDLLEPGGVMLIGNYHVNNSSKIYMEYWMDWPLNYRSESDFIALAAGFDNVETDVFFEKMNSQMFLRLKKLL